MGGSDRHELTGGIYRVETIEDQKLHGYHVLEGESGPIIVDSGYASAPTDVYAPFLRDDGWTLSDVSLAILTHADADHHGGNHELRTHAPSATLAAHIADTPLMESADHIMNERYGMFTDHGIEYGQNVIDWLTGMLGPDIPIDIHLRGGESICVDGRDIRVLHTPGHTRGHLMLYDEASDVVIGADGFFGRGLYDVEGNYLQPPPYHLYPAYENTIQLVQSLDPDVLSFTHYEVLRGEQIDEFITESLDFVHEIETLALELVDEFGTITLRTAIDAVVERRGSFGLDLDLAFPLSAHYRHFTERGQLVRTTKDGVPAWTRPSES